ncbi:hypothetical protein T439DRAFT_358812 [Meredithblackwellia eburnea MCA 4105]
MLLDEDISSSDSNDDHKPLFKRRRTSTESEPFKTASSSSIDRLRETVRFVVVGDFVATVLGECVSIAGVCIVPREAEDLSGFVLALKSSAIAWGVVAIAELMEVAFVTNVITFTLLLTLWHHLRLPPPSFTLSRKRRKPPRPAAGAWTRLNRYKIANVKTREKGRLRISELAAGPGGMEFAGHAKDMLADRSDAPNGPQTTKGKKKEDDEPDLMRSVARGIAFQGNRRLMLEFEKGAGVGHKRKGRVR